jgi:hypothetical protein
MQNISNLGNVPISGTRDFAVTRIGGEKPQVKAERLRDILVRHALPNTSDAEVNRYRLRNIPNVLRGLFAIGVAKAVGAPTYYGVVSGVVTRRDGRVQDLGILSCRVVTTTGVGFIVDAFQNTVELENMKFHGFGTGGSAEASGNTDLTTELTTEYAVNSTRPTGSTTEGASANIYRTVGTLSPDATVAITEHGIFDQAATGGGVLLDRSLFSAINLISGDSLQITYDLTLTAGS